MGTSVGFLTKEAGEDQGKCRRLWFTREPHLLGISPTEKAQLLKQPGSPGYSGI